MEHSCNMGSWSASRYVDEVWRDGIDFAAGGRIGCYDDEKLRGIWMCMCKEYGEGALF